MEREQINETLQHLDLEELLDLSMEIEKVARVERIRKPTSQTMLLPVTDPITGGQFYAGEVLVTSAICRVNGINGWAMVMDDKPELADAMSIIDGAYAAGLCTDQISALVQKGQDRKIAADRSEMARAEATRVEFDLL